MQASKYAIGWPILAITLVASLAFSLSLWLLYNTAFQRQLRDLEQNASVLANIMEVVAQHNLHEHPRTPGEAHRRTTLDQLHQGLQASEFEAEDEELLIGYLQGNTIKLIRKTERGEEALSDVPFDGVRAQPMYRALQGESGVGVLKDYAGMDVMAGYAPVPSLQAGIVFKIPVSQMQAPFVRTAGWAGGIFLLMLALLISGFVAYYRRHAKQIERSQQLFASIIEHIPSMIFMKRADDLSFVLINRNVEEAIGFSREDFIGKTDYDFFTKEQADFFTSRDRKVLYESGFDDIPEEQIRTQHHGTRILHTRKIALKNAEGKPEFLLGISDDITERKHQEELIAASNQLLNAVFDTTPVMIAYLDTDMNFVRVNQAYAAADNKPPVYFVGRNHFELYPNPENEAIFRRVIETGITHTSKAKPFEYEHNPERGISHWDWTLSPIKDNDGKVMGLVLSLLNVTEHIHAQEALETSEKKLVALNRSLDHDIGERTSELQTQIRRNELILSTTLEGFFAADNEGYVRTANPAFCQLLGYTEDELLQLHIAQFEVNENAEDVAAHIAKIIANGHDIFDTRHRRKDGHIVDVEVSVNLVEIAGEKMFYAFVHDISQRKQNEKELMAARDAAEQANRAKSEFLSRMSHELRTPMNAILGFAQVMQMQQLTPAQQDYILEIHHAGSHLLALINELLDLSSIEAGKLALAIQSVDVKTIVNQAVQFVQPLLDEKGITLINDCKDELYMLADAVRLRQILVNLLSNSAKYNTRTGFINIDCERQNDNMLRLAITDTGIGITPENIGKLFQPFERLGAEQSDIGGTGIGLALSLQLARLMGGTLGVDSTPDQGSTFWIDLPLATSPVHEVDSSKITETAITDTHKQVVLYIEDNVANLKLIEALFERHPQLYLLSATQGRQGLELARQYQPDTILLDIHLPDLNGFSVLKALKADAATRDIPVIALSADAMPLDVARGREAGFHDYLTKPIRLDVLITTLEKTLKK